MFHSLIARLIHGNESHGLGPDQRLNQPDPCLGTHHLGGTKGPLDPKNLNNAQQILIMVERREGSLEISEDYKSLIKINVSFVTDLLNISIYAPYTSR